MPEHQQTQKSTESKTTSQRQVTPRIQVPLSNPFSIIQRARINPKSLTPSDVLQLQRTIGNRAVGRLLSEIRSSSTAQKAPVQRQEIPEEEEPLQGKFENKPEQMTCPSCFAAPIVQRQELEDEERPLQGKMIETIQRREIPKEEEPLQGKMIGTVQRQETPEEEEPLQTKRENNTGMPDNLKAGVESLSGIDMSDVRVHYNSDKPAHVGALAYTQGTNIHVGARQERHLPHEAWHVVQQKQGRVQATTQMKGLGINDDPSLEHEADMMGEKTTQFVPATDEETLQGTDIHVGAGQEKHLPHEAWYVVQQSREGAIGNIYPDGPVQRQMKIGEDKYDPGSTITLSKHFPDGLTEDDRLIIDHWIKQDVEFANMTEFKEELTHAVQHWNKQSIFYPRKEIKAPQKGKKAPQNGKKAQQYEKHREIEKEKQSTDPLCLYSARKYEEAHKLYLWARSNRIDNEGFDDFPVFNEKEGVYYDKPSAPFAGHFGDRAHTRSYFHRYGNGKDKPACLIRVELTEKGAEAIKQRVDEGWAVQGGIAKGGEGIEPGKYGLKHENHAISVGLGASTETWNMIRDQKHIKRIVLEKKGV
ncbi:MAG: DUF4157 domain-containing protein [Methanosarcina sp.]